jgi:hypothetical protein
VAGRTPEETDRLVEQAISQQNMQALLDPLELDAAFVDPSAARCCGAVIGFVKRQRRGSSPTLESSERLRRRSG